MVIIPTLPPLKLGNRWIKKRVMTFSMYYAGIASSTIIYFKTSLLAPLASHRTTDASGKRKRGKQDSFTPLFMDPPPLVSSMTIGFNPTTQHLESEIQNSSNGRMKVVFVCRGDTTSTHLYAHFPLIASMLPHLRLVSFAKGAESRLCQTLQLKRVGVIGLMVSFFGFRG